MKNTTKQMLQDGKQTCGAWLTSGSDVIAEAMSQVGFDWICIDTEHGHGDSRETRTQLQGIGTTSTTPIVRVAWNDLVVIKKILDLGAQGLILPWVNSKDEAEQAVSYCKYPPEGIRGYAGEVRGARYGFDHDYLQTANNEVLIAVQIETREAVQNIEKIVQVPGIDVIFVGTWDLSFSLGCPLDFNHPDHRKAMLRIETAAKEAGKTLGTITGNVQDLAKFYDRGYQFVGVCIDMVLLLNAAKTQLHKVRTELLAQREVNTETT